MTEEKSLTTARPLYTPSELTPLMSPGSIAVVGASERPGSFGGQVLRNLQGATGVRLAAVNPRSRSVHGVTSVPSLADLEFDLDLAALCVPRSSIVKMAEEAVSLGVKSAVIYASGFSETGVPEDMRAEQDLRAIAGRGLRILGPNALGLFNANRRIELQFVPGYGDLLRPGRIGIAAQSGGLGFLLTQALYCGVATSYWAAPGNSCDVDVLDVAHYMIADPQTSCVALILEGVRHGARLFELGAAAAAAGKAVVVCKMGRSTRGAEAARSHTGTLAGSDAVFVEACRQANLVLVEHLDEIMPTAAFFSKGGRAGARGVGVMSSSGGAAVMAADEAAFAGVPLPPPSPQTSAALGSIIPAFGSFGNPCDLTAEAMKSLDMYKSCVNAFMDDPEFGLVIVPFAAAVDTVTLPRAHAISEVGASNTRARLAVVWLSEWRDGPGAAVIETDQNVSLFRSFRLAMDTAARWLVWSKSPDAIEDDGSAIEVSIADAVADAVDEVHRIMRDESTGGWRDLNEVEGKRVLSRLQIKTTKPMVIEPERKDVEPLLGSLEYPAVAKIVSNVIVHKSRAGGVRLNLVSREMAVDAVHDIRERFAGSNGAVPTVLVESMVDRARDWFLGARRDPSFGPVISIGVGGTDVESTRAVVVIVGPSTEPAIAARLMAADGLLGEMISGQPWVAPALASAAMRLRALMERTDAVSEVDLNPIVETSTGELVAVDAAFIAKREE
jgi:acetate---CoA ligase (ADP-forming)